MPDEKAAAAAKTTAAPKTATAKTLAPASESGDPAVHVLLAELQTARANGNDDEIQAVTKKLADLGYE